MHAKTTLLLLLLTVALGLSAQVVPHVKYTSKDGLIADRITAIAQDEKGFMWFGSYFGICRYDGVRFEKINLPAGQQNKYVTSLLNANGKMYAGFLFNGGLAEYANGKINAYFVRGKDSSFANEFVCMTGDGNGNILLANTSRQVYRFSKGNFTLLHQLQLPGGSYPRQMVKDRNGALWLATERGLYILPPPHTEARAFFREDNILSLAKDPEGNVWISRLNGKSTTVQKAKGYQNGNIVELTNVSQPQNVMPVAFTGNLSRGLWQVDGNKGLSNTGSSGTSYFKVPIDLTTDINTLFSDRESNLWIANEPGVIKVTNFSIQTYPFREIAAAGGVLNLANDTTVRASNSKSLYTITPTGIRKQHVIQQNPSYLGSLLTDRQKNLWIGLWEGGVIKTKAFNGNVTTEKSFMHHNGTAIKGNALVEDSKGNIWAAGANGIFRINGNKVVEQYVPVSSSGAPAFIICMALDEESRSLWVGDNASGITRVRYDLKPDGSCTYSIQSHITAKEGLTDTYIRSIFFDQRKNLWAGTRYGGIFRITQNGNAFTVRDCNKEAGITCTRVTAITGQDSSAVWFATCDGVFRYNHVNNHWSHFNTSNGLLNAEVFDVLPDAKNNCVWALTSEGVTRFRPDASLPSTLPLINITAVQVLGKTDSTALISVTGKRYSSSQNSIGFVFSGMSFIDEKGVRYRYILEGYDDDWHGPTPTNSVNYASLPPGKYRFKVMASNVHGQWSDGLATFDFEIVMPFYRRPWFIFLAITLVLFIVYIIRIQRLKQRYKIERLRLTIARDLHDDIGSTLGSINILSQTATRKLKKNAVTEEITPIFQKISHSAENTLEAMDDIVWSINPDKDKLHDLLIRMREFAIPLLEARNIPFSFEADGPSALPLPMNLRRNAFLIYKESIYNILKHAGATEVSIRIDAGTNFSMEIRDNGKGFNQEMRSDRNGLKNMKSRAASVNGNIEIRSSPQGTAVHFSAPVR
jgi:signal transduction histidine kinase/streptogramin lyase